MNLTGILARLDDHKGPGILFFEKGRVVRREFPAFKKDVEKAIDRLKSVGVKAGMRVGIRATNCYPWIVYDVALLELRAQSVAFTEDFFPTPADELQQKYKLGLILGYSKDKPHIESKNGAVLLMDSTSDEGVKADDSFTHEPDPDFECPSLIFSSGTSGRIKGLQVSRKGAESTINAFTSRIQPRPDDCLLMFLPISNYQQRMMCYAAMWFGFDLILTDPQRLFRALKELHPTLFVAPPLLYETIEGKLYNLPKWKKLAADYGGKIIEKIPVPELRQKAARKLYGEIYEALGGRMRFMLTGMAPIKRSTLQLFSRMQLPLFETYGLTECGPVALNVPGQHKPGSVGKPVEPGSVQIAEDGEIIVKKKHPQSIGYFDVPAEDQVATFLDNGSVATGDIGRFDEDGYLYLVGRKKEIIITPGGVKVHPEVLEGDIDASPDVAKSVVFGGAGMQTLVAVVSVRGTLDATLKDRIERHVDTVNAKHPSAIRVGKVVFTDTQLTRENGLLRPNLKLDRKRIQEYFANDIGALKVESPADNLA
ncbi:MAG: AMP-binding protein [Polyangiaceae bacterium]|nr:AMP-binding protein [Polyangiaceae bacterium]